MDSRTHEQAGMFIAYPTSSVLKSIFSPKGYEAMVNDQHTKIGITKRSFRETLFRNYLKTFDNMVELVPVTLINPDKLDHAKSVVLKEMRSQFAKVDRTRDWFWSNDHERIKDVVAKTLTASGVKHEYIGDRSSALAVRG